MTYQKDVVKEKLSFKTTLSSTQQHTENSPTFDLYAYIYIYSTITRKLQSRLLKVGEQPNLAQSREGLNLLGPFRKREKHII